MLTGVITKIAWTNPHTHVWVDVKDASGQVVHWTLEGYPPNVLERTGWKKDMTDPTSRCIFAASPRISGVGLFPIQFVQTPAQMIILYEYMWTFRVIPIGTKRPEDLSPSYMGNSVGRWEGDTFVVDVVGFKPGGWLTGGLVTSDALHLTERYTRLDRDQLRYEVTIEDPNVLTKPFTQRATLMLREDTRLREYSCAENNMDPAVYEKMLQAPGASQSFIRGK
jgi:hypothetical protein